MNEFLGYLVDRNYSPRTVRAYAFDLLASTRWLATEAIDVSGVDADTLLRFLTHCRTATHQQRPGGNVYSILDGRNSGYAPATINRRLAAISALFAFRQMRDPSAANPVRPPTRVVRAQAKRRTAKPSARADRMGRAREAVVGALFVHHAARLSGSVDAGSHAGFDGVLDPSNDRGANGPKSRSRNIPRDPPVPGRLSR